MVDDLESERKRRGLNLDALSSRAQYLSQTPTTSSVSHALRKVKRVL